MTISKIESPKPYPKESELAKRINDLIYEYAGEIPTVAAIGVLEMIKDDLIREAKDD